MIVSVAYGREGLDVEVPDDATVITPRDPPPLKDEAGALLAAFTRPAVGPSLAAMVKPGQKTVVVFPDLTRPMPNRTVLPPLLAHLHDLGIEAADITLLCSTGTHRKGTADELVELLGEDVVSRYAVEQNDCHNDAEHVAVGQVDGTEVRLDRRYVEADVKLVTGFVEPHFFAGFSGGPKAVCPGVADLATVLEAHSPRRIGSPQATFTRLVGNPVHDFVRAAAALCPPTMAVDVAIDSRRRLTSIFTGTLPESHFAACREVLSASVWRVPELFDVVITTNSGYPLDRNLYQSVKGLAAAERIVKPGGTIVMACECADGIPNDSGFSALLAQAESVADLASVEGASVLDRWSTQVLGRVLSKCRVLFKSEGLTAAQVASAHMEPIDDISAAVRSALGAGAAPARVAVLPFGPLSVADAGLDPARAPIGR